MADDMESDSSSAFKRRIAEIQHTHHHQETLSLDQQQQEQETFKESSDITSSESPKEDCSETSFEADSNLSKKLRSSYEKDCNFFGEKPELGSVNGKVAACDVLASGIEGNGGVCEGKVEVLRVEVEGREGSDVGCGDGSELCENDVERGSFCGLVCKKEKDCVKIEVGCSRIQECDKVSEEKESGVEVEMCPVVEGYSEERKEMNSEALLEAEKKRLLAEVEHGRVFEEKTLLEKASKLEGFCQIDEKLSGLQEKTKLVQNDSERIEGFKVTDASVGRSLRIEVIDETALIESIRLPKTGNGCVNGRKKGEKEQEGDGKKARRSRRKAKDTRKAVEMSEGLQNLKRNVEDQDGGLKNGKQAKMMYSINGMEALRFVDIVDQRKLWRDIYTGLGPAVMKEYDNLSNSKHQKHIPLNLNPQQLLMRKADAPGILREEHSQNVDNEPEYIEDYEVNMSTLNPACSHSTEGEDLCTALEGECSEDYDSDEDFASIQRPAFLVEGEPDFESGPPEDGLEYLRRVRWEAAHSPKVKVAKLDGSKVKKEQSVYMPQIPDIARCPEHLMPLKQWEDSFLADFTKLRLVLSGIENSSTQLAGKLQQMSIIRKENDSCQLLESIFVEKFNNLRTDEVHSCQSIDSLKPKSSTDQLSALNGEDDKMLPPDQNTKTCAIDVSGNYPTLSAILRMDSVARLLMLRKRIGSVQTLNTLSRNDCLWLFSLCAAVDTPLDADTCAALRSLLRKCASLRAGKSELDDEVVMLNIIATICGRYFGQSEN